MKRVEQEKLAQLAPRSVGTVHANFMCVKHDCNNSLEQEAADITCEEVSAGFDAFLHDELSEAEAFNVRKHLSLCNRCHTVLMAEVKFRSLVLSASRVTLPGGSGSRNSELRGSTANPPVKTVVRSDKQGQSTKIGIIAEQRYLRQHMPGALIQTLKARGLPTDTICPQGNHFDPKTGILQTEEGHRFNLNQYDVIVSRNRNGLGLAMLSYADSAGILTINRPSSIQSVRNKAKMAIALNQAAIPCPPTVLAENASVLVGLAANWFPLILKATYGDNSQGLRLIRRPEDLSEIHWGDDPVLAQHYLPNDGFDLKLYVCNRAVFAVRKPSPFNGGLNVSPEPIEPDSTMVDLALQCGGVFGLQIYGVDVIETADGPKVIEVNDFPNFTSVPDAADCIADYILSQLAERRSAAGSDPGDDL